MPRKPKKTAKPVNDADVIDLARREAAELLGFDFDRMDAGARLECDTDPDTDEPSIQRLRRFATATLETRACLLRLMSHAWPRLMPCFDGEASEVLMHPLATAFNVGDNHANHLSSGHALWGARTGVRWQKFNRVSQPRNNAGAQSLVNSLSIPGKRYPISACRHKVIRAPSVRLRLRIRILSQVSGGQEPKYERCSGVASCASQGVPSSASTSTLARLERPAVSITSYGTGAEKGVSAALQRKSGCTRSSTTASARSPTRTARRGAGDFLQPPSVIVLRSACGANRTLIRHRRMTGSDPATDMDRIEVPYRSESLT